MFTKKSIFRMFSILLVVLLMSGTASARPLDGPPPIGTGFTYQGKLIDGGSPANGAYDFQFKLFDALSGGAQVGETLTQLGVTVTNGLFTVQLDFGKAFDGTALYLEIGVRPGGSGGVYTTLTPRQPLTATPYALYTTQAGNSALLNNQQATYYQNASNINSGTLGSNFFSAYADLVVEGYLGNAASDLALNNGILQATLNADLLDGLHAASFALTSHTHWGQTWTGSGTGLTLSGGTIGLSGSGSSYGVSGSSTNGNGVYGTSTNGNGVSGSSSGSTGVSGTSNSSYGVYGSSTSSAGVYGSGSTYGVYGGSDTGYGVAGTSNSSYGVYGSGYDGVYGYSTNVSGAGVHGSSTNGYGVAGTSTNSNGVYGRSTNSYGVYGTGITGGVYGSTTSGFGVSGSSTNGDGVFGSSTNGYGVNGTGSTGVFGSGNSYGVWGLSNTTSGNGVYGYSSGTSGYGVHGNGRIGVWGDSSDPTNGIGVIGSSSYTGVEGSGGTYGVYGYGLSFGVRGYSAIGGGFGVSGEGSSTGTGINGYGGIGVRGASYNGANTNYAGYFVGNVYIQGSLTATGAKSAVVDTQDYGTRTLYAVESPENWFQDFGTGQLTNGKAIITIDPVFAETVNLADDYHVFFTPMGDCALYVTDKTPTSFTVKALGGQTCSIAFDYNIVAKRLGYETVRLAVADPSPAAGTPNGGTP